MYVDQDLVVVDLVHVVVQLVCRLGKHALRGDYPVCAVFMSFFIMVFCCVAVLIFFP